MNAAYRKVRFAMVIALFAMVWGASTGCSHQKPAVNTPTLYERVGGVNNTAILMDDIIERSYVHSVFEVNPRILAAHQNFPKQVYKFNATAISTRYSDYKPSMPADLLRTKEIGRHIHILNPIPWYATQMAIHAVPQHPNLKIEQIIIFFK